jgi:hypothetical protein
MSVMIGQISYLPNTEVRAKRLEASRFQIEFMRKLLPNERITVVAQAYDDSECVFDDVEYIRFENGIGAGIARNRILEIFYKSDYDWLLLLDDDTVFYEYYNYERFIHEILYNPEKFSEIDAVSAVEPEYHPYKKLNFEDRANLTHYKFEPRELNSGSATSIIRNIKKYYNKDWYYPQTDASKGQGREDIEALLEWLKMGLNWYTMDTWIRKSLCFDKSSIFGTDTKARDKLLMHDLDVVCGKYSDCGLQRNINGKITWGAFNERYNRSKKVLYIERDIPIEYDEKTTPKQKTNSKKLFDI